MSSIAYHLKELNIALDNNAKQRILPNLRDSDQSILDVGCGIGQTFVALNALDRTCVGVDIDNEALAYGKKRFGEHIEFIEASAEHIPLPENSVDLIISRVALPYTNIPKALQEKKRLLKQGGRIWLTFHDKSMANKYLAQALKKPFNIKRILHVLYIQANGYIFHWFGRVLPFLNGNYESWQSHTALKKVLEKLGFEVSMLREGSHQIIEARLASVEK